MLPKNKRKLKKKKYIKQHRNRNAGCHKGSGGIIRCGCCLDKAGCTKRATEAFLRGEKSCR